MKKIAILALAVFLTLSWGLQPAVAGTASRHRLAGAALALGTLGFLTILSEVAEPRVSVRVTAPRPEQYRYRSDYRDFRDYWDRRYDRDHGDHRDCRGHRDHRGYRDHRDDGGTRETGTMIEVRIWVPGHLESVWEPESWDHRGRYRPGRWVRRQSAGHYEIRRIWRDGDDR